MPAQKGKDLLIKIEDEGAFVAVAGLRAREHGLRAREHGLRAREIAFNAESVDLTHSESAGRWRELLAEAGVRRAGITGSGVCKDEASDGLMRRTFFSGAIRRYQVIVPDFGRIEGPFQITSLEYRGDHAVEVTFDMALESAGELTFEAF